MQYSMEKIGKNVSRIRKEHGFTQEKLAVKANITSSTISHLERGDRMPKMETMLELSKALGVDVSEFFENSTV